MGINPYIKPSCIIRICHWSPCFLCQQLLSDQLALSCWWAMLCRWTVIKHLMFMCTSGSLWRWYLCDNSPPDWILPCVCIVLFLACQANIHSCQRGGKKSAIQWRISSFMIIFVVGSQLRMADGYALLRIITILVIHAALNLCLTLELFSCTYSIVVTKVITWRRKKCNTWLVPFMNVNLKA